jgi:large conductance mechanosensitive channel
MWKEFKAFVMRGNVLDLAVGVIIGAAFGAITKSLVDDVLMPPLGLLTGGVNFADKYVLLKAGAAAAPPYASLATARAAGATTLNYGQFINAIITFLLVSLAVFVLVKAVNKLYNQPAPPTPDTAPCPFCTMTVSRQATRCPHCTSALGAPALPGAGVTARMALRAPVRAPSRTTPSLSVRSMRTLPLALLAALAGASWVAPTLPAQATRVTKDADAGAPASARRRVTSRAGRAMPPA